MTKSEKQTILQLSAQPGWGKTLSIPGWRIAVQGIKRKEAE